MFVLKREKRKATQSLAGFDDVFLLLSQNRFFI